MERFIPSKCLFFFLFNKISHKVPEKMEKKSTQQGAIASSSKSVKVSNMEQYPSHSLQLSLFVIIGQLELLHPHCQVLLLHLLPLPELPAPQSRLAVWRQKPQPQQLDACLNSCSEIGWESLINLPLKQLHSCTVETLTVTPQKLWQKWQDSWCNKAVTEQWKVTNSLPWIHSCFFFLSDALISKLLSVHLMINRHFFPSLSGRDCSRENDTFIHIILNVQNKKQENVLIITSNDSVKTAQQNDFNIKYCTLQIEDNIS